MQILPAVEIRSGKCVRLAQGDYQQETVYGDSPADMAIRWVNDGAEGLHVVDLDGARDGSIGNFESICEIVQQADVPVFLGGGIRDEATIKRYLDVGINRLVVGTRALNEPQWAIQMANRYPHQIMLGLDARDGLLATDGWLKTTTLSVVDFAQQMANYPIAGIVFTDIAKDGTLEGPNFEAQKQLRDAVNVPVIASGGIANADDVSKLAALKLNGCVIGRALYEGRLTLADSFKSALDGACQTPASLQQDASSLDSQQAPKGPHLQSIRKSSGASTP
jgi:phosphoribosylformimino-5-aminoimidazole carboxamide ribotide isomerase